MHCRLVAEQESEADQRTSDRILGPERTPRWHPSIRSFDPHMTLRDAPELMDCIALIHPIREIRGIRG